MTHDDPLEDWEEEGDSANGEGMILVGGVPPKGHPARPVFSKPARSTKAPKRPREETADE